MSTRILPLILFVVVSVGAVPAFASKTLHPQSVGTALHSAHAFKQLALADANNPQRLMNVTAFVRSAPGDLLTSGAGLGTEATVFGSGLHSAGDDTVANGVEAPPAHAGLMSVRDLLLMLMVLVGLVAFQLRRAHDSLQRPFTNS